MNIILTFPNEKSKVNIRKWHRNDKNISYTSQKSLFNKTALTNWIKRMDMRHGNTGEEILKNKHGTRRALSVRCWTLNYHLLSMHSPRRNWLFVSNPSIEKKNMTYCAGKCLSTHIVFAREPLFLWSEPFKRHLIQFW